MHLTNADGLFQIALANEINTRTTTNTNQANDLAFETSRRSTSEGVLLGSINTESCNRNFKSDDERK